MTIREGTRVIGITEWVAKSRVAGVRPLFEDNGDGWREADTNDYPPKGQVFWPRSFSERKGLVIGFKLTEGTGEDKFCVSEPEHAHLVADYRDRHYAAALADLARKRIPAPDPSDLDPQAYVLCADDILLGPLKVQRVDELNAILGPQNLDRVQYRRGEPGLLTLPDGSIYCLPKSPADGYLDCRPDSDVLKTALREASGIAREAGLAIPEHLASKKLIEAAVDTFVVTDDSSEVVRERLKRAALIFEDGTPTHIDAQGIVDEVLALPQSRESLRIAREAAGTEAADRARAQVAAELAAEREEIADLQSRRAKLEGEALEFQQQLDSMESVVVDRVEGAVQDATELLAESVLLRAMGVGSGGARSRGHRTVVEAAFPRSARRVTVSASAAFRNATATTSHPEGVFRRIHSALLADLVPVLTGAGGLSAIIAYARVACSDRLAMLPITHDFLHPVDLLGVRAGDPETPRMHANLLQAACAESRERPGLVVLESFNRAPTESYLVPWIATKDRTINVPPSVRDVIGAELVGCSGLLIAATDIVGSTTAPISPDLWSLAVAIDVPEPVEFTTSATAPSAVDFVKCPEDFDTEPIDVFIKEARQALNEFWPIDEGVLSAAWDFAAQSMLVGSELEARQSVVECSLVPALACSLSGPDLESAIDAIFDWAGPSTGHDRASLHRLAQRLRRRFQ